MLLPAEGAMHVPNPLLFDLFYLSNNEDGEEVLRNSFYDRYLCLEWQYQILSWMKNCHNEHYYWLGMVAHTHNPNTQKVEAGDCVSSRAAWGM